MSYVLLKAGQAYGKHGCQYKEYLIESYNDLAELPIASIAPGSFAHTPGYTEIYELGFEGSWVKIGSGSGGSNSGELVINGYHIVPVGPDIMAPLPELGPVHLSQSDISFKDNTIYGVLTPPVPFGTNNYLNFNYQAHYCFVFYVYNEDSSAAFEVNSEADGNATPTVLPISGDSYPGFVEYTGLYDRLYSLIIPSNPGSNQGSFVIYDYNTDENITVNYDFEFNETPNYLESEDITIDVPQSDWAVYEAYNHNTGEKIKEISVNECQEQNITIERIDGVYEITGTLKPVVFDDNVGNEYVLWLKTNDWHSISYPVGVTPPSDLSINMGYEGETAGQIPIHYKLLGIVVARVTSDHEITYLPENGEDGMYVYITRDVYDEGTDASYLMADCLKIHLDLTLEPYDGN